MSVKSWLVAGLVAVSAASYSQTYNSIVETRRGSGDVFQVSQKDAEKSIRNLAKTAYIEDAWMYYNDQLIDTGFGEDSTRLHLKFPNNIDSTKSITLYHIHPRRKLSPPSIEDIIYVPAIRNKLKANFTDRVYDSEGVWEFTLEESLVKELEEITDSDNNIAYKKKFEYFRHKMNVAYDLENKYHKFKIDPYPYNPTSVKDHIRIMKDIGVNVTYKKK